MYYANHTIRLQDGSSFNFKRRFKKKHETLLHLFLTVVDGRRKQGIRHSLQKVLLIQFASTLEGSLTIKESHLWAINNERFLKKFVDMTHGVPDETTIARTLEVVDLESLIACWDTFVTIMYNDKGVDEVASFDGKAIQAIHEATVGGHIVSLFTHRLHQTLLQRTVEDKSNEIPAAQRMLDISRIAGMTVVGDALHTQKDTIAVIRKRQAHYFLFVKGNQAELMGDIAVAMGDEQTGKQSASYRVNTSVRDVTVTIKMIQEEDIIEYLRTNWLDVGVIGRIHRKGTRIDNGAVVPIDETVHFISSRPDLTAKQAASIVRDHWSIENNLHWQKDYTFLEDRQRLRRGNAPSVMTYLRSCVIALFNLFDFTSVTTAIHNFKHSQYFHHTFLSIAAIV